ncbi:hypothetical protein [Vulcanisaeta sp. JCM 14467]|uniref:hypothetical protein n=1 Tax=Vulcanisaeta sp. JCM 14467 TaxID=1295370 RepID=UPI0006D2C6C3|nr:hypothetical protein [Vulcanisaeta sp. JCM 14467]
MGGCCSGGSISPGEAARIAYNHVYDMYRWEYLNMYGVNLRVVRTYRYGCAYNVIINVILTPISIAFGRRGTIRKTHKVQVDP